MMMRVLSIALAALFLAAPAFAAVTTRDEVQAPRTQDEVQAPVKADEVQAPRVGVLTPDEVQAARSI